MNKAGTKLINNIEKMTSPFHCVLESIEQLKSKGYQELIFSQQWELTKGQGYYIDLYGSTLIAFHVGEEFRVGDEFRFAAAHTDQPGLRIKGNPDVRQGKYQKLNVEVYGGPILNTWLDRPLSVAGRVSLKSEDPFHPSIKLVDFKRPILTIPNLAIHLDREVNKGKELNRQIDMLPLVGMVKEQLEQDNYFYKALASELQVQVEDILEFELYLYNYEPGYEVGVENDFIVAPRIDNITSVQSCLEGLIHSTRARGINVIALFDHEEVGSRSKKGAQSVAFAVILEKIYDSFGATKSQYNEALLQSFGLSVDVAHALHPNRPEKGDITNQVYLNDGLVIKQACSQSYAGDCETSAVVQLLCRGKNIPYQIFYNRSDATSGSTLGSIANTLLPIRIQDVGIALLAMHSSMETMGVKDQGYMDEFITEYFSR